MKRHTILMTTHFQSFFLFHFSSFGTFEFSSCLYIYILDAKLRAYDDDDDDMN